MDESDALFRRVQTLENFVAHLQSSNASLFELLKKTKIELDWTKVTSEAAEQDKEQAYVECKSAAGRLGCGLGLLHQECLKLISALHPNKPQLMCQVPLDELKIARRAVESNLKLFIVKQFSKKVDESSRKDNEGIAQLHHLIRAPDRKKCEQQSRDLDKLQGEYGISLANRLTTEAKNSSLREAISRIKGNLKNGVSSNSESNSATLKQLKSDIRKAAAKSAALKAKQICMANLMVKQTRLQYNHERMKLVQKMMERQTAVDRLVYEFMRVEHEITNEANQFLACVSDHYKKEADQMAQNAITLGEMRAELLDGGPSSELEPDLLLGEFQTKSQSSVEIFEERLIFLRQRSALMDQMGNVGDKEVEMKSLKTSMSQLETLLEEFKSEIHTSTVEFMKTKERQKMCQNLQPPVDLWQVFICDPEKLEKYLPKSD